MPVTTFAVNGRTYTHPGVPVVVICIDGSEPDYHLEALKAGRMPWLQQVLASGRGSSWEAHCAMPALTNPNNVSIATGRPRPCTASAATTSSTPRRVKRC